MIYLIKHLSNTYTVVAETLAEIPYDTKYQITHMPIGSTHDELMKNVDMLYLHNREEILNNHKNKFTIAMVQLKPDNTKDVLYANSYLNLLNETVEYQKLKDDSPMHHYEILNFHTNKFEVHIKREDAIAKLNQYMNEFVNEYKPNIVKEFITKEKFLEYIKL